MLALVDLDMGGVKIHSKGVSKGVLWGLLGRLGVLRRVSEWLSGVFWGSHVVSWVAFGLRVGISLAK